MSRTKELLRNTRPLSPAPWSVPVLIVLAWTVLTMAFPCRPRPEGSIEAFLTALVLVTFWANHVSIAPVSGFASVMHLTGRAVLDLIKLFFWWLVVMLPVLLSMPTYQCYNDRAAVAEWLASTTSTREVIANRIRTTGSTMGSGTGLRLDFGERAVSGVVLENGHVAMVSKAPAVALILVPTLDESKVSWTCIGTPEKIVPMFCRTEWDGTAK